MLRALIIDDEKTAREDLRAKLAEHPDVEIVGEAATLRAARTLLGRPDYDLVFLDIQLIGGSSFELVGDVQPQARIVFVTAYDSFALRAIEINALDYLLKPVVPARLDESLRRLSPGPKAAPEPPDAAPSAAALRLDDTLYLRSGARARFVTVSEISAIAAADNYTEVHLADGTRMLLRRSLKAWEDTLPALQFMRVHRTQLVNLARVKRYERDGDEHTLLYLEGMIAPVSASRYRWSELRERLATLRREP